MAPTVLYIQNPSKNSSVVASVTKPTVIASTSLYYCITTAHSGNLYQLKQCVFTSTYYVYISLQNSLISKDDDFPSSDLSNTKTVSPCFDASLFGIQNGFL